ncbi:MAG: head GIN domain-containing protein [Bacteroidota bacterium]
MKIRSILVFAFIFLVVVWNSGCRKFPGIDGNGSVITETRMSVSFNRIDNQGNFNVYYVYDTVFRVVIEAESNLVPHIRTVVSGNILRISSYENLNNNYVMKITVYAPVLESIEVSGTGLFDASDIVTDRLLVHLSGSGSIYGSVTSGYYEAIISGSGDINFEVNAVSTKAVISGSGGMKLFGVTPVAELIISGSGNIESFGMPVATCNARISGSGNIFTTVSEFLDVSISGSGNLYYRGDPVINSDLTGSGSPIKD